MSTSSTLLQTVKTRSSYICKPCRLQQQQRTITELRKEIPKPLPFVPNVETFLTLIGRNMKQHTSKFPSWSSLFSLSSTNLKDLGIEPARDRRYLLRWIENYRNNKTGPGGDFKFVTDGEAHLKICDVPSNNEHASASHTPGFTRLVLNVPKDQTNIDGDTTTLKKPSGYALKNGTRIAGPFAIPIKGGDGDVAVVKVVEGMWEDKRGKKVFGGERRKAMVLHKMGVEAHRKATGSAR